jgi:alpha-aminoadipate carrier protein LysW
LLQKLTGAGRLLLTIHKCGQRNLNVAGAPLPVKTAGGKEVPTGTCPECEADVHVDTDTDKGESVSCEECGVELEVVGLDPLELDIVEEDDLDDDDDEDEF